MTLSEAERRIRRVYSLDRIALRRTAATVAGMHLTRHPRTPRRAPDNELYDRGCDLVEAAIAIRELAGQEGAQRALPAVLGCMESALDSLAGATASAHAGHATSGAEHVERTHRGLVNLELALEDAKIAAAAARGLARRVEEP